MELTTLSTPLAALIGLAAGQLIAVCAFHIGKRRGYSAGRKDGFDSGYDLAEEELEIELNETAARCNSAERLLASTQAELRQTKDHHDRATQDAREAYEALHLQLDDAQVLNDQHARLLCDAADTLRLAANVWRPIKATLKADAATSQAKQLHDLAGWLKPQTQHMERAA